MAVRGITLERGTVVVLELDGTLVYVEDVQPTWGGVVALPEQPADRADDRCFTAGKVGVKKISPFSSGKTIKVTDLSPRNKEFIGTYEQLREKHGPHYVQRTPEEEAAMSVKKVTAPPRSERAGTGKRAQKRAALKNLQRKCAQCNQQPGHPNHPGDHVFVEPAEAIEEVKATRPHPTPKASVPRYTLVHTDLTVARAQPRGDKFNEGNRSHRVVLALASLPAKTGTLDEVVAALCSDGKLPPANPQKVVRRTLNQLTKEAFGSCVSTDGPV
jgi:hypothetical protein